MSTALCIHTEFIPLFPSRACEILKATVFLDWHIAEVILDMATSDDANDWPWGNDLLRQRERRGQRETGSYVSIKQWQLKKRDLQDAL